MSKQILNSKDSIREYISSQNENNFEDFNRLLAMNDASFFCYLAAINISSIYHFSIENYFLKDLGNIENLRKDVIFSNNLLIELMPMLNSRKISIIPNISNFKKLCNNIKSKEILTIGADFLKSKSNHLYIQNYLDFLLMSLNPYDSFIFNIQFRSEIVLNYDSLKIDCRYEGVDNFAKININHLMLLIILLDFHNHVFNSDFLKNKDQSMAIRAEKLFSSFHCYN